MNRDGYLELFRELTDKMVATTTAKNNDYAGFGDPFANFREFGTFGFLVRMSDKWRRIRNLVGENRPPSVKDESVEDTLIDLATYCLLLLCWLRAQKEEAIADGTKALHYSPKHSGGLNGIGAPGSDRDALDMS